MLVTVESCARDLRQTKDGREYTGLKINGNWVNVMGDHRDKYKKQIDVEIKGNWGQVIEQQQAKAAPTQTPAGATHKNGLNQWQMNDVFDHWWEKVGSITLDDAGKASIMCTLLIATADGRVRFEEPETPPWEEDNPFKD